LRDPEQCQNSAIVNREIANWQEAIEIVQQVVIRAPVRHQQHLQPYKQ